MTRSSESRAQRASRRGASNNNNAESKNDQNPQDEREQRHEDRGRSRHRRRSSSRKSDRYARARSREGGGGEGDVLFQFSKLLQQGAPNPDGNGGSGIRIDLQKASNVLEAAAGNMGLAANLYWDDYFATQAANPPEPAEDDDVDTKVQGLLERDHNWKPAKRRLRRSLDSDFQAADDDDETKKKKRAKRARKSLESNEGEDEQKLPAMKRNGNPDDDVGARQPSRRRSHRRQQMYDSDNDEEMELERAPSSSNAARIQTWRTSARLGPRRRRNDHLRVR